jgi:DHA1 family bicyclomycin/chloramphenicol resistance-like MFS transporter
MTVAAIVGIVVAHMHNGTSVPMAAAVAIVALGEVAAVVLLVRPRAALSAGGVRQPGE